MDLKRSTLGGYPLLLLLVLSITTENVTGLSMSINKGRSGLYSVNLDIPEPLVSSLELDQAIYSDPSLVLNSVPRFKATPSPPKFTGVWVRPKGSLGILTLQGQLRTPDRLSQRASLTQDVPFKDSKHFTITRTAADFSTTTGEMLSSGSWTEVVSPHNFETTENSLGNNDVNPPPPEQVAKMARFIVANSNWTSVATLSARNPTVGYPFANVFSVSDGPLGGNCTGTPYLYLTPLEISVTDLVQNSKASMTMSLAQGDYCRVHNYDPEDPRCAHVILTGKMVLVNSSSAEGAFARQALFSRHPEMESWPKGHNWFFAKLDIANILVLDYFGGAKTVSKEEYYQAGPPSTLQTL